MIADISAAAVAAAWCPGSGPATPSPATVPTGPPSSAKPPCRQASSAPDIERIAADVTAADGPPRFVWTDAQSDPFTYRTVILNAIAEQQRWRTQYEAAKTTTASVDSLSATGQPP